MRGEFVASFATKRGGETAGGGGRLSALFVRGKGGRGGDSIALKGVGRGEEQEFGFVLYFK